MTFRQIHTAECSFCRHVERSRENGDFIDDFFLPDICPSCGEVMSHGHAAERNGWPHWQHFVTKQEFKPAVRTRNPLTWLRSGRWEEVDRYCLGPA